jgi:hypothetical protein
VRLPAEAPGEPAERAYGRGALPTWPRVAVVVGVLLLAFFVAKGCQDAQVRITQQDAVATAKRQIHFKPTLTVVRLLRQGLNRRPFWIVSLSIPIGDATNPHGFRSLAVVKVDANTGKVDSVEENTPQTQTQTQAQTQGAGAAKQP